jgi:gliding motility-associated-like protein
MKQLKLLLFLVLSTSAFSQNLVLNPSFETTTSCPMGPSQFTLATNWDDLNTNVGGDSCSSPDLYANCSWTIGGVNSPAGLLGYQNSRTGTHHAGIIVESRPPILSSCPPAAGSVDNYREYIGGQLSSPLVAGTSYCVQMYVNLATKSGWGIDKLGFYFYNASASIAKDFCASPTPIIIPTTDPKLLMTSGTVFTDTVNWVLVNWNYVAQGGENRFAIGNFFDKTTQIRTGNECASSNLIGGTYSYYFIDDVSVTAGACCITTLTNPGTICVNDAAFNLIPQVAGGTFSGTGITNATSGTFNPAVAGVGTHTITYTLPCGSGTTQVTVTNCTSLAICAETNGALTVSGGTAPYAWQTQTITQNCSACIIGCTFPVGCAVNVTTWNTYATTATATPGSLPIQVIDNAGNSQLITTLATIPACTVIPPCPTIVVTSSSVQSVNCHGGNDGSATVSASGGTGPYSYQWMPGNLSGGTQTNLTAGTYTITATDANACTGTLTITITEPLALTITGTTVNADCNQSNGAVSMVVSGGTSPYTYLWSPNGATTASLLNVGAGVYTVTATDAHNCTISMPFTVGVNNGPVLTTTLQQNASCFGMHNGAASVSVSGGNAPYSYSWSPSGETVPNATQLGSGTAIVTVSDASGCVVSASIAITSPTELVLTATVTDAHCGSSDGAITTAVSGGNGPYTYQWTTSETTPSITNLAPGMVGVIITDGNGCLDTTNFTVNQIGSLAIQVTPSSATILEGESVQLTATGGTTYSWSPPNGLSCITCATTIATPASTTLYEVTGTDATGCTGVTTVLVNVQPNCGEIFVPSIFSPNEDGQNDQLCVFGNCFEQVQFSIFNRWGELVFTTDDLSHCWNARYKDKLVSPGVFAYLLTGKLVTGEAISLSGNIEVIR